MPGFPPGTFSSRNAINGPAGGGGHSAQANAWIARAEAVDSGITGTLEESTIATMIDALVAQNSTISGTLWSRCDAIGFLANFSSATALLNLEGTSFVPTLVGYSLPTGFTADRGFTGNGTSSYINSGFSENTGGIQYAQDSAQVSAWSLTSRTSDANTVLIGTQGASFGYTYIEPKFSGNLGSDVNTSGTFLSVANANAQGFYVSSRTSSSTVALYKDGSSVLSSGADTSASVVTPNIYVGAQNQNGTAGQFSNDQIAFYSMCAAFSATDVSNFDTIVRAALHALGAV